MIKNIYILTCVALIAGASGVASAQTAAWKDVSRAGFIDESKIKYGDFPDPKVGGALPQTGMRQPLPEVTHISAIAPDLLCIEIDACEILPCRQIPYQPEPQDTYTVNRQTKLGELYSVRVARDGFPLGMLVGENRTILTLHERLIGHHLNCEAADSPESYRIVSHTDADYAKGVQPAAVWRKSKPTNWTEEDRFNGSNYTAKHYLYLKLAEPLELMHGYVVLLPGLNAADKSVHFVYDPQHIRSEAVHCSQVGFRTDDPAKVAYLSCWAGNGGAVDYPAGLGFSLIDQSTDKVVFSGSTSLRWGADRIEGVGSAKNHLQADLYEMDFSEFTTPGQYRICVEGVGCGYPFVIDDRGSWHDAFAVSMKGLFHQRSGVAMLPPYTDFARPRMYHPRDGVKVYRSTASYMHSGNGYNIMLTETNNFDTLVLGKTDVLEPEGWGGVMDAGDWDRQIRHTKGTARRLFDLFETNPEFFRTQSYNIPESSNDLPDIINEALFQIDIYRRMQTPEGGIRGGVEASEHPAEGGTSWQEMLTVLAYAPDYMSSYIYAGVAARAAFVLRMIQKDELADVWQASAVKAMEWAETESKRWLASEEGQLGNKAAPVWIGVERAVSAAELYRLTNDKRWHEAFKKSDFRDKSRPEAAFIYSTIDPALTDKKVRKEALQLLEKWADEILLVADNNAFGNTTGSPGVPLGGWGSHLSVPASPTLVYAHRATGDLRYLAALQRSALYSAGANPMNIVLTTGVGANPIKHPLHEDSRHNGQPAPIGITVCGPGEIPVFAKYFDGFEARLERECEPSGMKWPAMESYFDIYGCDFQNEYVVDGNIGSTAFIWGYLASRR